MNGSDQTVDELQIKGGFETTQPEAYLSVGNIAFLLFGGFILYKIVEKFVYHKALFVIMNIVLASFFGYLLYVNIMLSGFILPQWAWGVFGFILPHVAKLREHFFHR